MQMKVKLVPMKKKRNEGKGRKKKIDETGEVEKRGVTRGEVLEKRLRGEMRPRSVENLKKVYLMNLNPIMTSWL